MNRFLTGVVLVGSVFTMSAGSAVAAHETALAQAATVLGYAYSYLGPEDAAALTRPGVTVVIRPGERLFDVNDRTEAMDGPAPRFAHDDIYISDALFTRLRQIAARYPLAARVDRTIVAPRTAQQAPPSTAAGAITNLKVAQIEGQQAISVAGKAPASLPVFLTLVGTFSTELPDVVLSRHTVTADTNGTFQSEVSIAPGYFRGGILTLVASSVAGVSSAKAQLPAKAPNGAVSVPADAIPRSIK